jgi:hypothetical protein
MHDTIDVSLAVGVIQYRKRAGDQFARSFFGAASRQILVSQLRPARK